MVRSKEPEIVINRRWCKGCGICIDFCPKSVFERDEDGKPVVKDISACIVCRMCELRCPDFAIRVGGAE
jgi:2-oxoglutarate ferredoxin oxidoreductase subunit delta